MYDSIQLLDCNLKCFVVVTSKIRNLKDYRSRLINNVQPLPAGNEIENTLKYFSQTLLR